MGWVFMKFYMPFKGCLLKNQLLIEKAAGDGFISAGCVWHIPS
jgi:hypothetical protein